MVKKLYVGNIPYTVTVDELKSFFSPFGEIHSINLITDRETGRSRGFGFIEIENADTVVNELNRKELSGRALVINEAHGKKLQHESFQTSGQSARGRF